MLESIYIETIELHGMYHPLTPENNLTLYPSTLQVSLRRDLINSCNTLHAMKRFSTCWSAAERAFDSGLISAPCVTQSRH